MMWYAHHDMPYNLVIETEETDKEMKDRKVQCTTVFV